MLIFHAQRSQSDALWGQPASSWLSSDFSFIPNILPGVDDTKCSSFGCYADQHVPCSVLCKMLLTQYLITVQMFLVLTHSMHRCCRKQFSALEILWCDMSLATQGKAKRASVHPPHLPLGRGSTYGITQRSELPGFSSECNLPPLI
uniref:Uncharacterized protein n=1 Tax=Eutreptiella gymnastica TaxID=73025 RepID=A0A7S1J4L9_9EUGL